MGAGAGGQYWLVAIHTLQLNPETETCSLDFGVDLSCSSAV